MLLERHKDLADRAMSDFGQAMGMAFQIADDILDYQGDTAVTGKGIGTDLREGKPTLPLIEACRLIPSLKERLRELISSPDDSGADLDEIVRKVRECGAIDVSRQRALSLATDAQQALVRIPAGAHRDALFELAVYTADRMA